MTGPGRYNYEFITSETDYVQVRIWLELNIKVASFCSFKYENRQGRHFYVKLMTQQRPSFFNDITKFIKKDTKLHKATQAITNLKSHYGKRDDFYLYERPVGGQERSEAMLEQYALDHIMKGITPKKLMKDAVQDQDSNLLFFLLRNWKRIYSFYISVTLISQDKFHELNEKLPELELCLQHKKKVKNEKDSVEGGLNHVIKSLTLDNKKEYMVNSEEWINLVMNEEADQKAECIMPKTSF